MTASACCAGVDLSVDMDDRIALLGANGNGKSTLAKLLAGRLEPLSGEMRRAPKLRVGYFAQHQTDELRWTRRRSITWRARCRTRRRAGAQPAGPLRPRRRAGGDNESRDLSGGEKARLLLALATRDAPQLLILDEPTNHLDIDAREALVHALADFEGAVLLITHDPHLVELVADRLWLVADGTVRPFDGDHGRISRAARRAGAARRPERRRRAGAMTGATGPRRAPPLAPLRRQAKEAEAGSRNWPQERARIEAKLADPAIYAPGRAAEVTAANQRLAAIARETEAAELRWLEASEALESAA